MIIKDSKNIANVYKGDTSIAKIYKGENLVYQKNNIEPILELDANTLYQEDGDYILRNKIEKYNYLSLDQPTYYGSGVSTDGEGGKYLLLRNNMSKLNDDVTPISLTKEDFNFTYITKISCFETAYTSLFSNGTFDGSKNWAIQKASNSVRLLLNNKVGAVKFQNKIKTDIISIRLEKLEDGSGKLTIYDHTNNEKLETTIDVSNIVESDKNLQIQAKVNFYYSAFYKQVLTDEQITSEIERLDKNNIGPSNILKFEFSGDTTTFSVNSKTITATTSPYSIDLNKELDGQSLTKLRFGNSTMTNFISIEDTSNITDMNNMFYNCKSLNSLDLSSFDTSKVRSMSNMFYNCKSLTTLDLSSFDTSNVTIMSDMFNGCNLLTSLNVSSFNTSKVIIMSDMFQGCDALTSLNLSNFDTSNVKSMSYMFYECNSLTTLDLSSFDTSNVTNMNYMFYKCNSLTTLDLSNFDTSKVTSMNNMFTDCSALNEITCKQTFKDWCIENQDTIKLPSAMRDGGSGKWIIVA